MHRISLKEPCRQLLKLAAAASCSYIDIYVAISQRRLCTLLNRLNMDSHIPPLSQEPSQQAGSKPGCIASCAAGQLKSVLLDLDRMLAQTPVLLL